MPVSNLHPGTPLRFGVLAVARTVLSESDRAERGDMASGTRIDGGGVRYSSESLRACTEGVEGSELEGCLLRGGGWERLPMGTVRDSDAANAFPVLRG